MTEPNVVLAQHTIIVAGGRVLSSSWEILYLDDTPRVDERS
jgi:hypothetical protein